MKRVPRRSTPGKYPVQVYSAPKKQSERSRRAPYNLLKEDDQKNSRVRLEQERRNKSRKDMPKDFIEYGQGFNVYMNHLVEYPKNPCLNYFVTLRDLTCDRSGPAERALFTTFGYERDFIEGLLKYAKVDFHFHHSIYYLLYLLLTSRTAQMSLR